MKSHAQHSIIKFFVIVTIVIFGAPVKADFSERKKSQSQHVEPAIARYFAALHKNKIKQGAAKLKYLLDNINPIDVDSWNKLTKKNFNIDDAKTKKINQCLMTT